MSTIDDLQRLHEAVGRASTDEDYFTAFDDRDRALVKAWPAIHRVLVAARELMDCPPSTMVVMRSEVGRMEKLFEALRALDDKEQRT